MREPNLAELRAGRDLQTVQTGAPLNSFGRASEIRHAQLDSWWERGLAVFTLGFVVVALVNFLRRAFFP